MDALSPNTAAFLNYINDPQTSSDIFSTSALQSQPPQQNPKDKRFPTSLPPSAFFNLPVPGRDTPEATPESSIGTSASPEEARQAALNTSSDDEAGPSFRGVSGTGGGSGGRKDSAGQVAAMNKRKAGHGHTIQADHHDDEDDDSGSDDPNGHEDKRSHPNDKLASGGAGSGRRGGRKSTATDDGSKGGKEVTKAAKRKEQNRAAQKAFRERREAKVKDGYIDRADHLQLEDQIAALEDKSQGAAAENENLRGILKRLQEENVALKQAAFTFTMPMGGGGSGTSTPAQQQSAGPKQPNAQRPKPPTPPGSTDDNLRSINDIPGLTHRQGSEMGMADSPESLVSLTSGSSSGAPSTTGPPSLDSVPPFNDFALGPRPGWNQIPPGTSAAQTAAILSGQAKSANTSALDASNRNAQSISPPNGISPTDSNDPFAPFANSNSNSSFSSPGTNDNTELSALWASFFPNGTVPSANGTTNLPQMNTPAQQPPTTSFGQTGTGFNSTSDPNIANALNPFPMANIDRMAFRDQTLGNGNGNSAYGLGNSSAPFAGPVAQQNGNDWTDLNDESINDFLASLSGGNTSSDQDQALDPMFDFGQDDNFNNELQKLLEASGSNGVPSPSASAPFNLSPSGFSPSAYLNFSPSPGVSASASGSGSVSNSHSPAAYNGARQGSTSFSNFSNSASPESTGSSEQPITASSSVLNIHAPPQQQQQTGKALDQIKPGEVVHVVGEDGKVLKPSDLWVRMGMQHVDTVNDLVIDDLCDQMKSKATCKDGGYQLSFADAEHLFRSKATYQPTSIIGAAMTGVNQQPNTR